jgi:hypothetical protein
MSLRYFITLRKSVRGDKRMEDPRALRHWMSGSQLVSTLNITLQHVSLLTMYGTVAVGAEEPLAEHMMVADFFRKDILATLEQPAAHAF